MTGASAMRVHRGTVLSHDMRSGFGNLQLGISTMIPDLDCFIWPVVGVCLCIQLIRGFALYIITPSSLKKRDNSVGSVGSVGKSEKSPENFPRKVFQNAYIAYTTYIGWGLEMDHWLDTVPLHSARSAVLVNIRQFFHGFFECISRLRFATKRLAELAISLVQLRSWILSICL